MTIPDLKPLHSYPMLFVLALINVIVLSMVLYLVKARSESVERAQAEVFKALQECLHQQQTDKRQL